MARRSQRKLAARRAERAEVAAAQCRRELAHRYPDVPVQVWANMGDGLLQGVGAKALRAWLDSVGALLEFSSVKVPERFDSLHSTKPADPGRPRSLHNI
jgi:hypothetical protein